MCPFTRSLLRLTRTHPPVPAHPSFRDLKQNGWFCVRDYSLYCVETCRSHQSERSIHCMGRKLGGELSLHAGYALIFTFSVKLSLPIDLNPGEVSRLRCETAPSTPQHMHEPTRDPSRRTGDISKRG